MLYILEAVYVEYSCKNIAQQMYLEVISLLFVEFDTSRSVVCHCLANVVCFGSFLLARYAISSQTSLWKDKF